MGLKFNSALIIFFRKTVVNWKIPSKMVKGIIGAMDLAASAENSIVAMMLTNRVGGSKLLKKCRLPLTGVDCVKRL